MNLLPFIHELMPLYQIGPCTCCCCSSNILHQSLGSGQKYEIEQKHLQTNPHRPACSPLTSESGHSRPRHCRWYSQPGCSLGKFKRNIINAVDMGIEDTCLLFNFGENSHHVLLIWTISFIKCYYIRSFCYLVKNPFIWSMFLLNFSKKIVPCLL